MVDRNMTIRKADNQDITELVNMSSIKRSSYEKIQPVFWRKAKNADDIQSTWFAENLESSDFICLVAENSAGLLGFVIGKLITAPEVYDPQGLTLCIDDFCMKSESDWDRVGKELLCKISHLAKIKGSSQTLIVTGAHDKAKRDFLTDENMILTSEWYVSKNRN